MMDKKTRRQEDKKTRKINDVKRHMYSLPFIVVKYMQNVCGLRHPPLFESFLMHDCARPHTLMDACTSALVNRTTF